MKKLITLFLILLLHCLVYGQLGVNTNAPNRLTDLDIKNIVQGNDTVPKGIMIPRMTKKQRDLIDVMDNDLANSLLIYNLDEDCFNYYSKTASRWKNLCGNLDKADLILVCEDANLYGEYFTKQTLDATNYISVVVKVTKPGSYSISALPQDNNGYYFHASGEFLTSGEFTIILQGVGKPLSDQIDQAQLIVNGNQINGCNVLVTVVSLEPKPSYNVNCSSVKAYGVYAVNQPLTSSNYLQLLINVDEASIGLNYVIETNTVDGIKFRGEGVLSFSFQIILLQGTGTPTTTTDIAMSVRSNSKENTLCPVTIVMAIPKQRLLTIGADPNGFGYNFSGTAASNKLITTLTNFGTLNNSVVKSQGFTIIDGGSNPSASTIREWLIDNPVDLVVIGYNYYNIDATAASYYLQYLSKGGVLLAFTDRTDSGVSQNLLKTIFNSYSLTFSYATGAGSIYQFSTLDNELLNGAFGDIRGLQWGEDASVTVSVSGLPLADIDILSGDRDISTTSSTGTPGYVTAFIHKKLNFVWVGDGGFNSSDEGSSLIICPFRLDAKNLPIAKPSYGRGSIKLPVYNSVFTANAIAWAVKQNKIKK